MKEEDICFQKWWWQCGVGGGVEIRTQKSGKKNGKNELDVNRTHRKTPHCASFFWDWGTSFYRMATVVLTTAPSALFPLKTKGLNLIISWRVTTAAARPLSFLICTQIFFLGDDLWKIFSLLKPTLTPFNAKQQSAYPFSTMYVLINFFF